MNALVPENRLYVMEDRPLIRDTLFHFGLTPELSEVDMGYMPQLGFLALKEGGPNLVGFRPSDSDESLLYSHPNALKGLAKPPTAVEVCTVSLPETPKIRDTRVPSDMFWSGTVKRAVTGQAHALGVEDDIVIIPQSLPEAVRQTLRTRIPRSRMLFPSLALINSSLAVRTIGGAGNET